MEAEDRNINPDPVAVQVPDQDPVLKFKLKAEIVGDIMQQASTPFSNDDSLLWMDSTLLRYHHREDARDTFDEWKKYTGIDGIAIPYYCFAGSDCSYIFTESFNHSFDTWVSRMVMEWEGRPQKHQAENEKSGWWKFIEKSFCEVFRDLIKCLRKLHNQKKYHGNLREGVLIAKGNGAQAYRAKLGLFSERSVSFDEGCKRDILSVRRLMSLILCAPFGLDSINQATEFTSLADDLIPHDLKRAFINLKSSNLRNTSASFLLDLSILWTWEEKMNFIFRMDVLVSTGYIVRDIFGTEPWQDWPSLIFREHRIEELYFQYREDRQLPIFENYLRHVEPEHGITIVRFIKNSYGHYNDNIKRHDYDSMYKWEGIEKEVSATFNDLYERLRMYLLDWGSNTKHEDEINYWEYVQTLIMEGRN